MYYSQKAYRLYPHKPNLLLATAMIGSIQNVDDPLRVKLLVDTGASFTFLSVQTLKELGYDVNNPIRYQKIVTGNGTINSPVVMVSWFNCLGQIIKDCEVVAYTTPANLRVDGLLGMDFLTRFQAIISVREPEIRY
jgi:predicted aspartyl protease